MPRPRKRPPIRSKEHKETINRTVADNIKRLRAEKEISQETLAYEAGVTSRTIQRVEDGQYSVLVPTLHGICQILGVDLNYMVEEH